MNTQDTLDKVVEPMLVKIFDKLNRMVFDGELTQPPSLRWYYGRKRRAGGFIEFDRSGTVWGIAVRGSLRDNYDAVRNVMLHEMTHLYLIEKFVKSNLADRGYSIKDFTGDRSSTFILELDLRCIKARTDVNLVKTWFNKDESETTLTETKYAQVSSAKALLGSLS
jgi:hypothetical protein